MRQEDYREDKKNKMRENKCNMKVREQKEERIDKNR